ncbi:MAG: hypothetical protein AAB303_00020 [Chloroflexota bacterium]
MAKERRLSKETFLRIAELAGLDTKTPHMEELYPFVQNVLQGIAPLDELDLTQVEPAMVFIPGQEQ